MRPPDRPGSGGDPADWAHADRGRPGFSRCQRVTAGAARPSWWCCDSQASSPPRRAALRRSGGDRGGRRCRLRDGIPQTCGGRLVPAPAWSLRRSGAGCGCSRAGRRPWAGCSRRWWYRRAMGVDDPVGPGGDGGAGEIGGPLAAAPIETAHSGSDRDEPGAPQEAAGEPGPGTGRGDVAAAAGRRRRRARRARTSRGFPAMTARAFPPPG
jgi:hypothetical protein